MRGSTRGPDADDGMQEPPHPARRRTDVILAVRRPIAAAALVLALSSTPVLTGCAEDDPRPTDPTETAVEPTEEPTEDPIEDPAEEQPGAAPSHSPLVAAAVADLAETLGVQDSVVEVVAEEEVTWSDGSLGCAKRGMSYTQALVDGTRIVLRVDGTDYEYHSGGGGAPFHCPRPTE